MKSWIIACVAVSSVAHAREPVATDAEKLTAIQSYKSCLYDHAAELDDGISDAFSVGRAIAPLCNAEIMEDARVFAKGHNGRVRAMLEQSLKEQAIQHAAAAVLEVRKRRHAN